ncbi:uncharacterized protein EV422DRAFT_622196 [Fimicolochytrium jonesii]|uniref:uncharacterized protein n=1 Tax=Fimicolochytrium jonesii TaxID=1396493 RepID=UPI0022FE537B|nr:uncharacterized protein EV422DRAFT_622196 [Fimicolochytrium jonesii]KAI8817998.1 hypothetical protein EV422DRAFT_622196 [Fimicolochytrium jonesii]
MTAAHNACSSLSASPGIEPIPGSLQGCGIPPAHTYPAWTPNPAANVNAVAFAVFLVALSAWWCLRKGREAASGKIVEEGIDGGVTVDEELPASGSTAEAPPCTSAAFPVLSPKIIATLDDALHKVAASPLVNALHDLIDRDGAGTWPPEALNPFSPQHADEYPEVFRPYFELANEVPPRLAVEHPDLDDKVNLAKIRAFRTWMDNRLTSDIPDLEAVLTTLQSLRTIAETDPLNGDRELIYTTRRILNFILSTLTWLAHAYRWGTIPIVRIAQAEKTLEIPQQLLVPVRYLHTQYYGLGEQVAGTLFALLYCNVEKTAGGDGEIVHWTTRELPRVCSSAERFHVLTPWEMEKRALAMYRSFALAAACLHTRDTIGCLVHLRRANAALRVAFKHFYTHITEKHISRKTWLSHAQGFEGWSLDGVEGVSGNQALIIRVLDAFLSLPDGADAPAHLLATPIHLTHRDRQFTAALRGTNCRHTCAALAALVEDVGVQPIPGDELDVLVARWEGTEMDGHNPLPLGTTDDALTQLRVAPYLHAEFTRLTTTLRTWRSAHATNVVKYESVPRPERTVYTAGGGHVDEDKYGDGVGTAADDGEGEDERQRKAVEAFVGRLRARVRQTV